MKKHISNRKSFFNYTKVQSGAEALAAASFSVLFSAITARLISGVFYRKWPDYPEFTAGGTVYSGYQKQGDLILFYLLIFLIPSFYVLFLYGLHKIKDNYVNQRSNSNQNKIRNIGKEEHQERIQKKLKGWQQFFNRLSAVVLACYAMVAVETALSGRLIFHKNTLSMCRNVAILLFITAMIAFFLFAYVKKRNIDGFMDKVTIAAQLFLPFCFLGYFGFFYQYENESSPIELFHSSKWKYFCVLVFLFFIICQVCRIIKKKNEISVFSMISIATMSVMKTPEGILSVDFFHNGEMAFPMQQLISYGKIPYFDLDPIHGLCDYVYSMFNYLFFDGSYFAQNVAVVVAQLWIAAFLAVVLWYCLKHKSIAVLLIWIFMPYLAEKAEVRYVFFLAAFLILLSDRVRKNSLYFVWWWTLLCMAGILYNVSIGASMAVAFLPEILYRLKTDLIPTVKHIKEMPGRDRNKLVIAYGILFVIGICYIPWFLQIIRFLRENAGTTIWANGTAIFGDEFRPVATFALFVPYLAFLTVACSGNKKGKFAFLSMAAGLLVICNYACVRYDEALRLAVLAVLFSFLMLAYFLEDFLVSKSKTVFLILMAVACGILMKDYLPIVKGALLDIKPVPAVKEVEIHEESVEDPVVYVSGDSVQMSNLGSGFIQGLTLNSLKNVQSVLDAEHAWDSYLDLTNKISHYVIFDCKSDYPFTSAYNISNNILQDKAIRLIEKQKPHLVLLSPYIRFDEAPIGIRSPGLYHKLMAMGYKPYVYEDVIYLLDTESEFALASDGRRRMGQLNHRTDLGMLPYLWGTAFETEKNRLEETVFETDLVNGGEVDYLELLVDGKNVNTDTFSVSFQSMIDQEKYMFLVSTGLEKIADYNGDIRYVIPLGSSPFFSYSDKVEIHIEGIEVKEKHYYRICRN